MQRHVSLVVPATSAGPDQSPSGRAGLGMLTVRRKILFAFLAIAGITVCYGTYAIGSIAVSGVLMVETFDRVLMSIDYARAASADFAGMEAVLARQRASAPEQRPTLETRVDELATSVREDLEVAAERSLSSHAAATAHNAMRALAAWQAIRATPDDSAEFTASDRWTKLDAAAATVNEQLELLINHTASDGFKHRQAATSIIRESRVLNGFGTAIAVLLAGWVASMLSRQIMTPVRAASAAARRIAAGDLDARIPRTGRDELGALLSAMEAMRDNLQVMMSREVALRRSAQVRLTDAIESSHEGVLVIDQYGKLAIANSRLAKLFPALAGLDTDAAFSTVLDAAPELASPAGAPNHEVCLASGTWLRVSRSPTQDGGFVAICTDITALKQREAELRGINLCFDAALNNMSQGLCLFDAGDRLRVSNPQFAEIYGIDPADIQPDMTFAEVVDVQSVAGNLANTYKDAIHNAHRARRARDVAEAWWHDLPDGRVISVSHEPLKDGGFVETYEDITERRRAEAQIDFMARHDALTGLANRMQFQQRVEQALAQLGRGVPFAILSIGLHDFKLVNDVFGYPAGDALLQAVAERLQSCVREIDLVAKLANDEFGILQCNVRTPEEMGELANRLMSIVGGTYAVAGHELMVGLCIGLAMAPADGTGFDALLRNADLALHRARLDGRNTFRFFEAEMDARLQARRQMQQDLHLALGRNELELFYQPLVEISTDRVCGFEALLRWRHPERGMVSPAEFIPVAEDTGLIVEIGEWVIENACREAATWPDGIKVAVNVSPLQFKSPALLERVIGALESSGLAPSRLELEVTETVLLRDDGATLAILHRLRDIGVRVSMDDFGTGYSSLSYLRSFPFDKIKVDQSFVRDLATKVDSVAIIRAIAGLGLTLGMRTTAEGVETAAQLDEVRAAGCTEIQGYFFSKPVRAGLVPGLIRDIAGRLANSARLGKLTQPALDQPVLAQAEEGAR